MISMTNAGKLPIEAAIKTGKMLNKNSNPVEVRTKKNMIPIANIKSVSHHILRAIPTGVNILLI